MASDYEAITEEYSRHWKENSEHAAEILASMYSQRTHFIFELLQNAEDVEATSIRFDLFLDRLEVRHDGRPFNTADVRGVCHIGEGTKARDRTKIGKFGVGFKSVYNYTSSPEIHSGEEHFRIERYLWPRDIAPRPIAPCETLFILPFDHASVSAEAAFREIGPCLKDLDLRTMLFLKHIKQIEWHIVGSTNGSYLRDNPPEGNERRVTIIGESTGSSSIEEWLVFERSVIDSGQDLRVQAAFLLAGSKALADERIVGAGNCPLIVFFPTDKGTHLHFLIQGPYNTTTARDNVHEDDDLNRFLIEETARLVAWTLPQLRDMELLSVSLLESLPIREQDFPPGDLFRPVYEAVREAFGRDELLPAHGGGYVRSQQARLADGPLRQLVTEDQLRSLSDTLTPLRWISDQITLNRTPDLHRYLRTVLIVPEIAPIDFVRLLSLEFLKRQTDGWIVELYTFLERQQLSGPLLTLVKQKPIIRLEDGSQVAPFSGAGVLQAYLPAPVATTFPSVKRDIATDERARSFLKALGLKDPDLVDEALDRVLSKYERGTPPTDEDSLCADLEILLQARAFTASPRLGDLRRRLESASLIRVVTACGDDDPPTDEFPDEPLFRRPSELYFRSTELERYFRGDCTHGVFPHACYDRFGDRLAILGFQRELKPTAHVPGLGGYVTILDSYAAHSRGVNGFDPKADVDDLEFILDSATWDEDWVEQASFIWNRIAVPYSSMIRGVVETSTTQDFKYPKRTEHFSTFGQQLADTKWLPDRSGALHRPADLALEDLPDGFQPDEQTARQLGMKSSVLSKFAEEAGVDLHVLTVLRDKPEQVLALLQNAGLLETDVKGSESVEGLPDAEPVDYAAELKASFSRDGQAPEYGDVVVPSAVQNPPLRRERTEGEVLARMAEEPEPEARYRVGRMRIWEERNGEVRTFLHAQYGGKCQICQLPPFSRRGGEPYFTGVYLVSRTKGRWIDRPGNALCLCPNCCAKFVFGAVEADDIVDKIASFKMLREGGDRTLALTITLCGRPATIRYSERHMIDLQALLTVSAGKSATAILSLLVAGA